MLCRPEFAREVRQSGKKIKTFNSYYNNVASKLSLESESYGYTFFKGNLDSKKWTN